MSKLQGGPAPAGPAAVPLPPSRPPNNSGVPRPEPGRAARSSVSMAVGTLASRVLGFIKGLLLGVAVAGTAVADIFDGANTFPNIIFLLVAGGVFNAVLIPQIAKASRSPDKGAEFISRLLTLAVIGLLALTILVTALAAPLMHLLTAFSGAQLRLAVSFALLLLPQIFFYGLYSLLGQVLNAHNSFAAYAWAPVVNNVVAIGGLILFITVAGSTRHSVHTVDNWTAGQSWMLAGTATLGIVVQSVLLILPVRRLGLKLRPRFGFRGTGLGATGKIAGWTMGTMIIGNLSFLLITKVATIATEAKPNGAVDASTATAGLYTLQRATEVYIMPHSVIALSIATVMFTQMAHAAASRDLAGVRVALSRALRTTGAATVFASIALIVLAGPLGMLFSGNREYAGRQVAITLAILAIGVPFYSINFILNRVFYAQENAKTPFVIQSILVVLGVTTALLSALAPPSWIIYALACSYTLSNVAGAIVSHVFLRRTLGDYGAGAILRSHMRFLAAALVAGVIGDVVLLFFGGFGAGGFLWHSIGTAAITLVIAGPIMAAAYVAMLKVLRAEELNDVLAPLTGRLRSRIPGLK